MGFPPNCCPSETFSHTAEAPYGTGENDRKVLRRELQESERCCPSDTFPRMAEAPYGTGENDRKVLRREPSIPRARRQQCPYRCAAPAINKGRRRAANPTCFRRPAWRLCPVGQVPGRTAPPTAENRPCENL